MAIRKGKPLMTTSHLLKKKKKRYTIAIVAIFVFLINFKNSRHRHAIANVTLYVTYLADATGNH